MQPPPSGPPPGGFPQQPGYPPQSGYPQQPGYPPQSGYPQQPGYGQPPFGQPPRPPKKRSSVVTIVLLIGGAVVACGVLGSIGSERETPTKVPRPLTEHAIKVDVAKLLSEYKNNELRADGAYKDKLIETSGKVDDIKKDILDTPYVTVGTGNAFEIPQLQCMLKDSSVRRATKLSKGDAITVRGKVSGLMFNVLVNDCEIVE